MEILVDDSLYNYILSHMWRPLFMNQSVKFEMMRASAWQTGSPVLYIVLEWWIGVLALSSLCGFGGLCCCRRMADCSPLRNRMYSFTQKKKGAAGCDGSESERHQKDSWGKKDRGRDRGWKREILVEFFSRVLRWLFMKCDNSGFELCDAIGKLLRFSYTLRLWSKLNGWIFTNNMEARRPLLHCTFPVSASQLI